MLKLRDFYLKSAKYLENHFPNDRLLKALVYLDPMYMKRPESTLTHIWEVGNSYSTVPGHDPSCSICQRRSLVLRSIRASTRKGSDFQTNAERRQELSRNVRNASGRGKDSSRTNRKERKRWMKRSKSGIRMRRRKWKKHHPQWHEWSRKRPTCGKR